MQRTAARRVIVLSSLGVLAMGAIALTGWFHPNAPSEAMSAYLPAITLPTVLAAAALDGINPCAFTVLLLFITSLVASLPAGPVDHRALRGRMLRLGSIYIGAVFLTYLALGVGILQTIDLFSRQHLPARLGGLAAVLLGLWMLKDYFLPDLGPRLQAPPRVATSSPILGPGCKRHPAWPRSPAGRPGKPRSRLLYWAASSLACARSLAAARCTSAS